MARRPKRLYGDEANRKAEIREFERRYPGRGEEVYGAVVGKTAEEQAAHRPGGVKLEQVKGHISMSDRGTKFRVRPHTAMVHAHRHGSHHHGRPCNGSCQRGLRDHRHPRGSSRGG